MLLNSKITYRIFCLVARNSALVSFYDYLWEKSSVYHIETEDIQLAAAFQEFQRYTMLCRNNFSYSLLDLKPAAKISAKVAQELSEQFNPDRYEQVEKQIKDFFDGPKFLSIMEEIDEIEEKKLHLNQEQYN